MKGTLLLKCLAALCALDCVGAQYVPLPGACKDYGPFVESGNCDSTIYLRGGFLATEATAEPILTKSECEAATTCLGLPKYHQGPIIDETMMKPCSVAPPGCFFNNKNLYVTNGGSTGSCSPENKCVCLFRGRAPWSRGGRRTLEPDAVMKPVMVVGADARSAPAIMQRALTQGRKVVALARHPDKVSVKPQKNLKIVGPFDAYNASSIAQYLEGNEDVISCLGPHVIPGSNIPHPPVHIYSVGYASIISAMQQKGKGQANRLVAISSGGVEMIPDWMTAEPTDTFLPESQWTAVQNLTKDVWLYQEIYYDMRRMEQIITQAYGIQYAIFRLRAFNNISSGAIKFQIQPDAQDYKQYDDLAKRIPGLTSQVSYEDVAVILLDALDNDSPFSGSTTGVFAADGVGEPFILPARVGKQELR